MSDPITWANAQITWEPDGGYKLRLPHWADRRALALRHDALVEAIDSALPGRSRIDQTFIPMKRTEDENCARADHGEIIIGTETMLTEREARELRDQLGQALNGAVQEAERVVAEDGEKAAAVLAILKMTGQ